MELTENWEYILGGILIILPLILITLELIENRIRKKIEKERLNKKRYYHKKMDDIISKDPNKNLNEIDKISQELLTDLFKLRTFKGYGDLEKYFLIKGFLKEADFCRNMNKYLYSQKKPDLKKINELKSSVEKIIEENIKINQKQSILKKLLNFFNFNKPKEKEINKSEEKNNDKKSKEKEINKNI
jgi:hypothetical protein